MRLITFNANGIRSAARKGFFRWLSRQRADVVCVQELKAQPEQLTDRVFHPKGHYAYFHAADKKGYSGVALYARRAPDRVHEGLNWPELDVEGRYLQADFGRLSIVSLYLPSGTSGEERQAVKYRFMDGFEEWLRRFRRRRREYIICGDWNIAHTIKDIKNWRANQGNSGFLPEERAWMDKLFGPLGYVDALRVVDPRPERYTWWSFRGRAWENNTGWRIDYQVLTPGLAGTVARAAIYTGARFSDHAPLIIDYDMEL